MKRSEMIYKLAGFICDIKMSYTEYTWTNLEKPEAEELLKLIEEAGMLPPSKNGISTLVYDGSKEQLDLINRVFKLHQWEPEGEENE